MKAFVLFLVALSACSSCATVGPNQINHSLLREYSSIASVIVFCEPSAYPTKMGSAIAVDSNLALTAAHVVKCDGNPQYKPFAVYVRHNSQFMEVDIVKALYDENEDVALLKLKKHRFRMWVEISRNYPRIGDEVCTITGAGFRKCGFVAQSKEKELIIAFHAVGGNSGAAVFNKAGQVIGILTAGTFNYETEEYTVAIPTRVWFAKLF